MFKFNGVPYRRSSRSGGSSVSMVGMLALLLTALLVVTSCIGDDTETVQTYICPDGTQVSDSADCPPDDSMDDYTTVDSSMENPYNDGDGSNMLVGTEADDYINGEGGDDSIMGVGGNDTLTGGDGNDTLDGGDGDDMLMGDAGNDDLMGGAGDDMLTGGDGNNTLDGGDGNDFAVYKDSSAVSVDLRSGQVIAESSERFGLGSMDTLMNIENIKGSQGDDIINGDDNSNILEGLDGADEINGYGGDDTIFPNRPPNDDGTANRADDTADPVETDGSDMIDGGGGTNTLSYAGELVTVTVTLVPAADDDIATENIDEAQVSTAVLQTPGGSSVTDYISTVEQDGGRVSTIQNIVGGAGNDSLTGDGQNNMLTGGAGADTLNGGAGNDTLNGADGVADTALNGGLGDDMIYADANDTTIDAGEPTDDATTTEVDETTLDTDTVSYEMVMDADTTTDGNQGVTITALEANSENLIGTDNVDSLTGNAQANVIMGLGGDDTLNGDAGADTLNGGAGNDSLTGAAGSDVFVAFSGEGPDTITDYTVVDGSDQDEIHLKNFSSQDFDVDIQSATNVQVLVDGEVVLNVTTNDAEDTKADLLLDGKIVFVTTE